MTLWISLAALAGASALMGRWLVRGPDPLGRTRPAPFIAYGLLLSLGLGTGWLTVSHHRLEDRLSNVASQLAGKPVKVHCQTFGGSFVDAGAELGYVKWGADGVPETQTLIKRDVCNRLADFVASPNKNVNNDDFIAVHILTHEAMHMSGEKNEAKAECMAVQRDARTARLLGATEANARALAVAYFRDDYPRLSDGYISPDCKPGGAMDEGGADAPWASRS